MIRAVAGRVADIDADMRRAERIRRARRLAGRSGFNLPLFPTTTIGSFPQTAEVRKARAAHAKGDAE